LKQVFAPGFGLALYKPELAAHMLDFLREHSPGMEEHLICCRHEPYMELGTQVINVCAGCDRRYRELHDATTTISFWEILAESESFPFPDYQQQKMAILDACPTRDQKRVHRAIRSLLSKMNIELAEPQNTGTKSTCCGDSFLGAIPVEQVKEKMRTRAQEMPADEVVVYCVSRIKSMHIGGKNPRYLVDLLFGETTQPGTFEPEEWHRQLDKFIEQSKK